MANEEEIKIQARRDAFARIAFWQTMAFVFLLCFAWANEILDFPSRVFGAAPSSFNVFRICIVSAAIIAAGVIAIGKTYEEQRGLLRRLLKTCLYCHRVRTPQGTWEHVEEYFIRHYPVAMERGVCSECEQMVAAATGKKGGRPAAPPSA